MRGMGKSRRSLLSVLPGGGYEIRVGVGGDSLHRCRVPRYLGRYVSYVFLLLGRGEGELGRRRSGVLYRTVNILGPIEEAVISMLNHNEANLLRESR